MGARPAPDATVARRAAAVAGLAPSDPLVSVGPVLAVPGIGEALSLRRESVIAVSPIVGGAALKGPAARLMTNLGEEASVVGVARRYAPFASALIIDTVDADLAGAVAQAGMTPVVAPSIMDTPERAAELARVCLAGAPR